MRKIVFYETETGKKPVQEFLDSLSIKESSKVILAMRIVRESIVVPSDYFKHLKGTQIYEIRAQSGNNIFRLLCFFHCGDLVVVTNGFAKKSQKTPKKEIEIAENRRADYIKRMGGLYGRS